MPTTHNSPSHLSPSPLQLIISSFIIRSLWSLWSASDLTKLKSLSLGSSSDTTTTTSSSSRSSAGEERDPYHIYLYVDAVFLFYSPLLPLQLWCGTFISLSPCINGAATSDHKNAINSACNSVAILSEKCSGAIYRKRERDRSKLSMALWGEVHL